MKISLVIPSRNNLKYLIWAYNAIQKHKGDVDLEVCVADDASTDGTWEWCEQVMLTDPLFKAIKNPGPERIGLAMLFNKLIFEVATGDIVGVYHADMYLCPNALQHIQAHIRPGVVVSLTRIEPPLHPAGPEKILADFAIEPEFFDEQVFLDWYNRRIVPQESGVTDGVFAPWFIYKTDFVKSNGHDRLFAPQSKDDSDIFNRFALIGYTFIQTREGHVYHMTSRGSRFNPMLTTPGVNSREWEIQNKISERNFIRKWGNVPLHTPLLKPIIPPHYKVVFAVRNATLPVLRALEPWATVTVVDNYDNIVPQYIESEQPRTLFNLEERIKHLSFYPLETAPVVVEVDTLQLNEKSFTFIQQLLFHLGDVYQKAMQTEERFPLHMTDVTETVKVTVRSLEEKECNYVFH